MMDSIRLPKKRKVAPVKYACINCRIAKRACDNQRPCGRCKHKQLVCTTVQPKFQSQLLADLALLQSIQPSLAGGEDPSLLNSPPAIAAAQHTPPPSPSSQPLTPETQRREPIFVLETGVYPNGTPPHTPPNPHHNHHNHTNGNHHTTTTHHTTHTTHTTHHTTTTTHHSTSNSSTPHIVEVDERDEYSRAQPHYNGAVSRPFVVTDETPNLVRALSSENLRSHLNEENVHHGRKRSSMDLGRSVDLERTQLDLQPNLDIGSPGSGIEGLVPYLSSLPTSNLSTIQELQEPIQLPPPDIVQFSQPTEPPPYATPDTAQFSTPEPQFTPENQFSTPETPQFSTPEPQYTPETNQFPTPEAQLTTPETTPSPDTHSVLSSSGGIRLPETPDDTPLSASQLLSENDISTSGMLTNPDVPATSSSSDPPNSRPSREVVVADAYQPWAQSCSFFPMAPTPNNGTDTISFADTPIYSSPSTSSLSSNASPPSPPAPPPCQCTGNCSCADALQKHNELLERLISLNLRQEQRTIKTSTKDVQMPCMNKTPYSLWELETERLVACNTAFQKMIGFSMTELSEDFECMRMVPQRYQASQQKLWEFLSAAKAKVELSMCLQEKDGHEICVRTLATPMQDQKHVMMEHHLADYCDDQWSLGDFTHFKTEKVLPTQCKTPVQNIYEIWNFMKDAHYDGQ